MMWTTLRAAATGLEAQQRAIDLAANNLANLQTTGYKQRRAALAGDQPAPSVFGQQAEPVGQGVIVAGSVPSFAAGAFRSTGQPLDLAISGDGFLAVSLPDGRTAYTRDGALRLDATGRLVTGSGLALAGGPAALPAAGRAPKIESDGTVTVELGQQGRQPVGRLSLARFVNPDGLEALGGNLFLATAASGEPVLAGPGVGGVGTLQSGGLEGSNVDLGSEMVRLLQAQRAYQVSVRQVRTIDEMVQAASNLRR